MLDDFAILSTTLCILFILFRAAVLDRSLPWFELKEPSSRSNGASPGAQPNERNFRNL